MCCLKTFQLFYLARSEKVLLNPPFQHPAPFTLEVCGHFHPPPPLPNFRCWENSQVFRVSQEPTDAKLQAGQNQF